MGFGVLVPAAIPDISTILSSLRHVLALSNLVFFCELCVSGSLLFGVSVSLEKNRYTGFYPD